MPDPITILATLAYVGSVAAAYYYGRGRSQQEFLRIMLTIVQAAAAAKGNAAKKEAN
jgi:hypothetical protein